MTDDSEHFSVHRVGEFYSSVLFRSGQECPVHYSMCSTSQRCTVRTVLNSASQAIEHYFHLSFSKEPTSTQLFEHSCWKAKDLKDFFFSFFQRFYMTAKTVHRPVFLMYSKSKNMAQYCTVLRVLFDSYCTHGEYCTVCVCFVLFHFFIQVPERPID